MTHHSIALLLLTLLFGACNINAQKKTNSAERTEQQTKQMIQNLDLNEEQAKQVAVLNEKFAAKAKNIREEASGDREMMRSSMKELNTERNAELKKILSEEQYKKHLAHQKEMRQNRMQKKRNSKNSH